MQTHLTEHLIGQCFHEGVDSDSSRHLMVHLDRGCYACQKVMRVVAAGEKARYSHARSKLVANPGVIVGEKLEGALS